MHSDRRNAFTAHPLALLSLGLAAGIMTGHLLALSLGLLIPAAALTCAAIVWLLRKRRYSASSVLVIIIAVLSGATLETIEQRQMPGDQLKRLIESETILPGDPVELTGTLDGPLEAGPERFAFPLRLEKFKLRSVEHNASGVVQLQAPLRDRSQRAEYAELELHYGARLRVMIQLERADNFRNPGVSSFNEFLDRKGYDATGVIKSPLLVERLEDRRVFLPLVWLYRWHENLAEQINARFSAETAGVLDAALLGNRQNLSHATAERFRQGGTFHILVINGLHISFIGFVVLLIVRRITERRSWQFIVTTLALWSYAIAVGLQPAVVRASLMFTLVALAPLLSRRANSLNALGGAALVLLVWRPSELFDPSFQLTFLSVLAIVVIAVPLMLKLSLIGAWRPSRDAPQPPRCARWLRGFCEALFWSERDWQAELTRSNYRYRLFKSPIAARLERMRVQWLLRHALGAALISASVQIAMLPLLIIYFHRVSPGAIILNIGVAVLLAVLAMVALAALLLAQLSLVLATPLIALANLTCWLLVHSVDLFTPLGGASFRLPEYTGALTAAYILYYLPLALLVLALARWRPLGVRAWSSPRDRRWRKLTTIAAGLQTGMVLLIICHPLSRDRIDGLLRIDFLDVGQGDAVLVTFPEGTTILIDGGGRPDFQGQRNLVTGDADDDQPFERDTRSIGESVVSEYLWWRGLDRVDYILATHADADHIDGLNDVARNFQVRAAFVARTPPGDPEFAKFAATLAARNIPLQVIGAGDQLSFGPATVSVLWPPLTPDALAPSGNNDSIVLRLQCGERRILLTGDIEKEGEAAILSAASQLTADVVKVPHHGSKTSSTSAFVAASHPRLAVISVGLTSIFGHPNKDVVERWHAAGAEVMTTGRRGTITVKTDGKALNVETFVP